jgi:U4/U6 small nuclear ribonucleoprotein PRP31
MEANRLSEDFLQDLEELSEEEEELESEKTPCTLVQPEAIQATLEQVQAALASHTVRKELETVLPGLIAQLDQQVVELHHIVREVYAKRFPELDSQAQSPLEYCRLAAALVNETDISKVDLTGIVPNTKLIAIAIALSSTSGKPLNDAEIAILRSNCIHVETLVRQKGIFLQYLEMVVTTTTPNLCELLGSEVASRILSASGGLQKMVATPACIVQVMGQQKGPMLGLSAGRLFGFLAGTEIVRKAPEALKKKAVRMLAAKSVLAARVDFFNSAPTGSEGIKLRENVLMRLEKATEGPPASAHRPLPVPEDRPRPHRGGQRVRAAKKKFQMTEIRKYANRVKMGVEAQEEFRDTGEGFGMLGNTGKLRVKIAARPIGISAKKKRQMTAHSGGTESGLTSAFAFSQSQELKLENPESQLFSKPVSSYFAPTSGFATVLAEKLKAHKP